jgi:hypothetical protein
MPVFFYLTEEEEADVYLYLTLGALRFRAMSVSEPIHWKTTLRWNRDESISWHDALPVMELMAAEGPRLGQMNIPALPISTPILPSA